MQKPVLAGLKVLDFTWSGYGPLMGACLADHGAEVIKVESIHFPDLGRAVAPYKDGVSGVDRAYVFSVCNTSKRSMALNMSHPEAIGLAKKLVVWADVVIESFRPGVMQKWGLDYEHLKELNEDIIMLSASFQGQTGPHAQHVGLGIIANGLTGITHFTGWPDRAPAAPANPLPDFLAPWFGVLTLAAALDYRRRTGRGMRLDVSQFSATLHLMGQPLIDHALNGEPRTSPGNRSFGAAPHGAYKCRGDERWCAIAVSNDAEWEALTREMGDPALGADLRFSTLQARKTHEDELDSIVERWTSSRDANEVAESLQRAGVPAGIVASSKDVCNDPQLAHREFFQRRQHPEIKEYNVHQWPFRLPKTPASPGRAPCLGEHTSYVCTQILGVSDDEFLRLLGKGIFE